jgi:hypothetical protein
MGRPTVHDVAKLHSVLHGAARSLTVGRGDTVGVVIDSIERRQVERRIMRHVRGSGETEGPR